MTRTLSIAALAAVAGALTLNAQTVRVELNDAQGRGIGTAALAAAQDGGVAIALDLAGLPPGEHALHFHETGVCEPPFASAGGHLNPGARKHGLQNPDGPHAGDMVNFTVAADGTTRDTIVNARVTLGAGAHSVRGVALVIHAGPDDMKSDPAGNAGGRIACGVVPK